MSRSHYAKGLVTPSKSIVIDLDGVIWLAGESLPGVDVACNQLRDAGFHLQFATNNSAPSSVQLRQRLGRAGITCDVPSLITAAQAAASLPAPGSRVLTLGEQGLREACEDYGHVESDEADVVIVGWCQSFGFDDVAKTASAVRAGARFIATNDDPTHPTPNGLLPGTGALVAAISTAAETVPEIAGKPGVAMVSLIEQRCSDVVLVIGDRPSTDGALASSLGRPFALVRSDATPVDEGQADIVGESLLDVVASFLS